MEEAVGSGIRSRQYGPRSATVGPRSDTLPRVASEHYAPYPFAYAPPVFQRERVFPPSSAAAAATAARVAGDLAGAA